MKSCRLCGVDKPLTDFGSNKSAKFRTSYVDSYCKPCRSLRTIVQRHGISIGELEDLKRDQNNSCAICGTHADDIVHAAFSHNPLVVDHDHVSGTVRGLLCPTCNSGLGHFKDDPVRLGHAITYLARSPHG